MTEAKQTETETAKSEPKTESETEQKPTPKKDDRIRVGHPHQGFLQSQSINMTTGMAAAIANITQQLGSAEHDKAALTRDLNNVGAVLDKERKERAAEKKQHESELAAAREATQTAEAALALARAEVISLKDELAEAYATACQ